MKCYQILFSPTGGTEKVATAITQNWPEVQTIDLSSTSTDFLHRSSLNPIHWCLSPCRLWWSSPAVGT